MSIEKLEPYANRNFENGTLDKEPLPFTQLLNKPIQELPSLELIGLWAYLQSLPPNWHINFEHLHCALHIGKNKLYRLFAQLIDHNLISKITEKNENGTYKSTRYKVLNGTEFNVAHPLPGNPHVDLPHVDNETPINKTKKQTIQKEKIKHSCASDDARSKIEQSRFEDFWKVYPRKRNKDRAKKIWASEKLDKIAEMIITDVENRSLNDSQWQEPDYILYPSTYLQNKRWEDELTLRKTRPEKESHFEMMQRVFSETAHNEGGTYND